MDVEGKRGGRGRGRGRGRGGRGRPRGRGRGKATTPPSARGRPKKMIIESDQSDDEEQIETSEIVDNQVDLSGDSDDHDDELVIDERENSKPEEKEAESSEKRGEKVEFTLDDDISQLVPPTFSTVSKGPPQPMLELTWDQKYTPIGEKLPTPNIHMCVGCKLPIRIYGRLIPCKHVYCHSCALKQSHCTCCSDRVSRIEQAHLGQVFMCNHGGTRYSFDGCRRTYLSQRDLQAHVDHRHKPRSSSISSGNQQDHSSRLNTPGGNNSSHYDHSSSQQHSYGNRQNIPVHYSSTPTGNSGGNRGNSSMQNPTPGNSNRGQQDQNTPASRYERKSSFNRNNSWNSYNNNNNNQRQF